MKGDIINCPECAKEFAKRRSNQKYCSKHCCNEYNRKRRGDPAFDFDKANKKDNKVGNTTEPIKPENKPIYVPTKEYRKFDRAKVSSVKMVQELENEKQKLIRQYGLIASRKQPVKDIFNTIGEVGAIGIGAGVMGEIFDDSDFGVLGALLGTFAFGLMGHKVMKDNFEHRNELKLWRKLNDIELRIQQIDQEINSLSVQRYSFQYKADELIKKKESHNKVTAAELRKMKFDSLYIEGKYGELLGDLSPEFSMIVYGSKGSGKSTLTIDLANDLYRYGKVAYIAAEEGISKTTKKKFSLMDVDSPYLDIYAHNELKDIEPLLTKDYKFIIVDSITEVKGMDATIWKGIINNFKGGLIGILQATKDGNFKGDSQFGHDVDILLKVDKGIAENEKNRFGGYGNVNVFDDKKGGKRGKVVNM